MTGLPGPEFYDDDAVFATSMSSRKRTYNPNDTLERPVINELLGDISGCRVLDLGFGGASLGRLALARGARAYVGIEGSQNMVGAARETLRGTPGQVLHADLESWNYPDSTFDVAVSSLALHYVADLDTVLGLVFQTLVAGGRLVISVEHPVITSCDRGWQTGQRQAWLVDDYFAAGPRETSWLGGRVTKHHRTMEGYFAAMQRAGFVVDGLRESDPAAARFADPSEYERRKRIPLFLFLEGHKPKGPRPLPRELVIADNGDCPQ